MSITAILEPVSARQLRTSVTASDDDALLARLQEHGVPVYTPESVTAYQAARVEQLKQLLHFLCEAGKAGTLAASALLLKNLATRLRPGRAPWLFASSLLTFLAAEHRASGPGVRWTTTDFAKYEESHRMPSSARLLGQRLAGLGLTVTVDAIEFDPMMFIAFGAARYCVAVWNEPGFDGQLLH